MDYTETTIVNAEQPTVWAALAAVTTYPRWTTSMTAVAPLDGERLAVGHRYRVSQPGLPTAVWRVIEVCDGESFTWENRSPGLHSVASHSVSKEGGATIVTLRLQQNGPLAGLLARLTGKKTRRFMALEAAGVKAAAESVTMRA
jgi:hypothetical protein